MAIALVVSTQIAPAGSLGGTTPAVNTTGANLIVLIENDSFSAPVVTLSDNQGNTYTIRANVVSGSSVSVLRFYDCYNPVTNASHTFTASSGTPSFAALTVLAFSGAADTSGSTGPWVGGPGTGTSGTTSQPGAITIGANNTVVVSATTVVGAGSPDAPGTFSVDSGFTIGEQMPHYAGRHFGQACAYFIQAIAGNIQPTFTYGNITTSWGAKSVAYASTDSTPLAKTFPQIIG